jgi:SAM-dependent methyltransferase
VASAERIPEERFAPSARELEWEDRACPLGCRRDDASVLRGSDRLHGSRGEARVVRCRGCGLLRTNPRPTLATIGRCYPEEDYGPYRAAPRAAGALARLTRSWRLGEMAIVPPLAPGRALEIGCASGAFLARLRESGWDARGIEPSPAAAARARAAGFDVYPGPAEDAPALGGPFDLVVARHSLEHLHDPVRVLVTARRQTRTGGFFVCTLPDAGSWLLREFGADWYDLDLPRHLFHFEVRTLARLLDHAGWHVERVRHQATTNPWLGSLALRAGRVPERPRWAALLEPVGWGLGLWGRSGRMMVWARAA